MKDGWIVSRLNAITIVFALLSATLAAKPSPKQVQERKLEEIIIPEIDFSEATVQEAVEFLRDKSVNFGKGVPENRGVSILVRSTATIDPDKLKPDLGRLINLKLNNVRLSEALRFTTELAGFTYRIGETRIEFIPIAAHARPTFTPGDKAAAKGTRMKLEAPLAEIDLVEATIEEAADFIRLKTGLNIVVRPPIPDAEFNPAVAINLKVAGLPRREVLGYIAELAGYKVDVQRSAVVFTPAWAGNFHSEEVFAVFPVPEDGKSPDVKAILKSAGVDFPKGSEVKFVPATQTLYLWTTAQCILEVKGYLKEKADQSAKD